MTEEHHEHVPEYGAVSWFDLTVENADEIRDFYRGVVGWGFQEVEMEGYSDYSMTTPVEGNAVAGIVHARGPNEDLPPQWMIYITVEDLGDSMAKCVELGGHIVAGPFYGGEQGSYCMIRDPAGAVAALFQPDASVTPPEHGGSE